MSRPDAPRVVHRLDLDLGRPACLRGRRARLVFTDYQVALANELVTCPACKATAN